MHPQTFFLSAILALATASLASEHEHKDRSPAGSIQGPDPLQKFLSIPELASQFATRSSEDLPLTECIGTTQACINALFDLADCNARTGTDCSEQIGSDDMCPIWFIRCPSLATRQSGGGSPLDSEVADSAHIDQRDNTPSEESLEIASEDAERDHLVARAASRISDIVSSAIPAEVQKAILDDPKAPDSLAKEFSGTKVPNWYAKLPASVTDYYVTITPPPTMMGAATKDTAATKNSKSEKQSVDEMIASVKSYTSRIGSEISAMSATAVSESQEASRLSVEASTRSKFAHEHGDKPLETKAWSEGVKAASISRHASHLSSYAASASEAIFTGGASPQGLKLARDSSIFAAVVCLGVAMAL